MVCGKYSERYLLENKHKQHPWVWLCHSLTWLNATFLHLKQQCIPVGCILPARYHTGLYWGADREPMDRDYQTKTHWTETPLWTETP